MRNFNHPAKIRLHHEDEFSIEMETQRLYYASHKLPNVLQSTTTQRCAAHEGLSVLTSALQDAVRALVA